ncbi:hypothetical protein [Cohnella fermenti]|uniref:Uncharacterized protein n=1 Tax=Cohnella fermenti TaxID=2565925 RepID=A0A4V3WGC9_9BACL|nr:hypothetical protein [Cohnella fermenti]THF83733.1 hypothetical protein E6C55_03320 [Cohnella fermenti]
MSQSLSETFSIPKELHPLWIRYIEKAASDEEWDKVNKVAVKLLRAKGNTIGSVLAMSKEELRLIRGFTGKDEVLLLEILGRIADRPELIRK